MTRRRVFTRALKILGSSRPKNKGRAALKKARKNPSRRDAVEAADSLLESFTGSRARKEIRGNLQPIKTGLVVGSLRGVHYVATRDGETADYYHEFKKSSRPLLISNHDGSRLGIFGGRYRFTDTGINDT